MYRSGLILGGITLLVTAVVTAAISPICTPCFVFFLGAGAGYVTGLFNKPSSNGNASKAGAISGALAGIGALLGLSIGSAINGLAVGPERALQMSQPLIQQLGLPAMNASQYATTYWFAIVGWALFCGVADIVLMAGTGALGGLLWWQTTGKSATPPMGAGLD